MSGVDQPVFSAAQPVVLGFRWPDGGGRGGAGRAGLRVPERGGTLLRDLRQLRTPLGESNRAIEAGE